MDIETLNPKPLKPQTPKPLCPKPKASSSWRVNAKAGLQLPPEPGDTNEVLSQRGRYARETSPEKIINGGLM